MRRPRTWLNGMRSSKSAVRPLMNSGSKAGEGGCAVVMGRASGRRLRREVRTAMMPAQARSLAMASIAAPAALRRLAALVATCCSVAPFAAEPHLADVDLDLGPHRPAFR